MKKLFIFLTVILLYTCNQEPTTPDKIVKPETEINDLVRNAGKLPVQKYDSIKNQINFQTDENEENGIYYKSNSVQYHIENNFDEIVAFNSIYADALYPGSILQGKDIVEGKLTPLGDFPREPITLTMQGGNSKIISNPTLSTVTTGIIGLLAENTPTVAAMTYSKSEIHSSKQAFLELGLDVNWLTASLKTNFQEENSVKSKSIFLYFKQVYYTVAVNSFSEPSEYFANNINLQKLQSRVFPGNPPCYISRVDFGRIMIVKVTSDTTYEAMKSAIASSFFSVGGQAGFHKDKFKLNCTFNATIVGGSAQGAANAITSNDIEAIHELIRLEAKPSPSNPGYPISFTVRYLDDGSTVQLGSETDYWQKNWEVDENKYKIFDINVKHLKIIDDGNGGGDGDFFYNISIRDKNDNIIRDINGNECIVATDIYSTVEVGDGSNLPINKIFPGIKLKNISGESFTIKVELWDVWWGTDKYDAGHKSIPYYYPFNSKLTFDQTIDLEQSLDDYITQIVFVVSKR